MKKDGAKKKQVTKRDKRNDKYHDWATKGVRESGRRSPRYTMDNQ